MSRYAKAYGTLVGAVVGIGIAHGLIPESAMGSWNGVMTAALPIVTSILGTIFSPKNAD